jgi:chromosome segregation and condensation protein ScpB
MPLANCFRLHYIRYRQEGHGGQPTMFGTTDLFLKQFNIASLNQLPSYEEFCSENELKTLTV